MDVDAKKKTTAAEKYLKNLAGVTRAATNKYLIY